MTAVNHALTGTLIGLVIGQPLAAVPLAVASHFVCDALPHFGTGLPKKVVLKSRAFRDYLFAEAFLCFLLVVMLAVLRPQHWLLAAVCAFAAASPDFVSAKGYLKTRRGLDYQPGRYARFASDIQWFERPIGAVVEVVWFVSALVLLVTILR
ncbi:MAG TPA: hypothetical protein VFC50_00915 [Candidatus Dormibacteraeota bacterium]|nr:hypothetical protein [Candidatus Dormibacteraeota bacterium]